MAPGASSREPHTLPTSRIHRLFRPFLSKLSTVQALFPTPSSSVYSSQQQQTLVAAPSSRRTYSRKGNGNLKLGETAGHARGLPTYRAGAGMKRTAPRGIPRELVAVPQSRGSQLMVRPSGKNGANLPFPQLPGVELAEVSKRVHALVKAFENILDVAYPARSSSVFVPFGPGPAPLSVSSSRRVGQDIELWIDDQLREEFGLLDEDEDEDEDLPKMQSRRIELRDEWWETIPEHWRRFAVPVHALEIALAADIPLHGLYEALLECCIERYAVYEVSLLLPHLLLRAFTLPSVLHPPGSSYLPTLARKPMPKQDDGSLGFRWSSMLATSILTMSSWLDAELEADEDSREARWLGDGIDGFIRDGKDDDAAATELLVEVVRAQLERPDRQQPFSDIFRQRLEHWTQHHIYLSNRLRAQAISPDVFDKMDSNLARLGDLLHEHLSDQEKERIATTLLGLDMHILWTTSLRAANANTATPTPRIPADSSDRCNIPLLLASHTSLATVLSLATTLRAYELHHLESWVLSSALEDFERLSTFYSSKILSAEEKVAVAQEMEVLSDMATEAEGRCLANGRGVDRTPGGTKRAIRWEEMVGGWVEATPLPRARNKKRSNTDGWEYDSEAGSAATLSENEEDEEEEDEERWRRDEDEPEWRGREALESDSDDPMDALSDGEEGEVFIPVVRERSCQQPSRLLPSSPPPPPLILTSDKLLLIPSSDELGLTSSPPPFLPPPPTFKRKLSSPETSLTHRRLSELGALLSSSTLPCFPPTPIVLPLKPRSRGTPLPANSPRPPLWLLAASPLRSGTPRARPRPGFVSLDPVQSTSAALTVVGQKTPKMMSAGASSLVYDTPTRASTYTRRPAKQSRLSLSHATATGMIAAEDDDGPDSSSPSPSPSASTFIASASESESDHEASEVEGVYFPFSQESESRPGSVVSESPTEPGEPERSNESDDSDEMDLFAASSPVLKTLPQKRPGLRLREPKSPPAWRNPKEGGRPFGQRW